MIYIPRHIQGVLKRSIESDESVILLGPRQTGKTTLVERSIDADLSYTFLEANTRRRFEEDPDLLISEIKGLIRTQKLQKRPTVLIDEVQKVPEIMDAVQWAIDQKLANFILTGSSARKLRRKKQGVNLLPGRVVELHLSGLALSEIHEQHVPQLEDFLLSGSLPKVFLEENLNHKERLLSSYVNIYLEEEIRAEALVQNLSHFSRFLNYAAVDAGKPLNISSLAREIGVNRYTIESYYQILEDCLIVDRIDPITETFTRRRLTKSPKYLFFDLGVRRVAAGEGLRLPQKYFGDLFEQFIGVEILKLIKIFAPQAKCYYWRDHGGAEVDYVIEYNRKYLPIEVKWSSKPSSGDAKHLRAFMREYECCSPAYIICQTPRPVEIDEHILAVHWKELSMVIQNFLGA